MCHYVKVNLLEHTELHQINQTFDKIMLKYKSKYEQDFRGFCYDTANTLHPKYTETDLQGLSKIKNFRQEFQDFCTPISN